MTNTQIDIGQLSTRTNGPTYVPGEDAYQHERAGYQLRTAHEPDTVVAARDGDDVRAAVEFAATRGMPVAVQATGHGLADAMKGGVLISTRNLRRVTVDAGARTAWVQAGASWGDVIAAAAPRGLAPLSGSMPGVGAVSYTLGGGIGLLARRYGFAADHVRRFDLVTADGHVRQVTASSEPELFWALRGGGGNFGVITGMEIDLFEVASIYGGGLFFDVERVPEVLEAWREWTEGVPEAMTSAVSMLPMPDLPMVAEPLRGKHVAQVQVCYVGPAGEGEELVEPLRAIGPLLRDTVRELPYADSGAVFDEPDQPHAYLSDNRLVSGLEPGSLSGLPARTGPAASVMCVTQMRHLGGALAREPQTPSAVSHRRARYALGVLSVVEPGADEAVRALHREVLSPFASRVIGRSLNFNFGPLEEDQVAAGFDPESYRRLRALKAGYDPGEVFHSAYRIPPTES